MGRMKCRKASGKGVFKQIKTPPYIRDERYVTKQEIRKILRGENANKPKQTRKHLSKSHE